MTLFRTRCDTGWTRLDGSPYVTLGKPVERDEAERRIARYDAAGGCHGVHTIVPDEGEA